MGAREQYELRADPARIARRRPIDEGLFVFDRWDAVIGATLIGVGLLTLAVRWLT